MTDPVPPVAAEASAPIVARAGRYYRNARYIMVLGLVIMGGWFLYDGFMRYPEQNAKIDEVEARLNETPKTSPEWAALESQQRALGAKHQSTDLALQKLLGFALPLVALGYLAFFLNKSRGEIRLENDTLHVPGHPAVPMTAITSIDNRLWKKKGIATVKYAVHGKAGAFRLDDFVYEQTPIDAIYDRINAQMTPPV